MILEEVSGDPFFGEFIDRCDVDTGLSPAQRILLVIH
jgi:hypothetical protein